MHVSGAGEYVGLTLLIDVSRENYMAYVRPYYGVQILVHDSDRFPDTTISKAVSQPGYETAILVKPSILVTGPEVRSVNLDKRRCLFPDEVYIQSILRIQLSINVICFYYRLTV